MYVRGCIYLNLSPIHWTCYIPVSLDFARFEGYFNNHGVIASREKSILTSS